MTRDVVTVQPSDTLAHAAQLMGEGRFRHLPVVSAVDQSLVGIISATDVVHAVPLGIKPFTAAGFESLSGSANRPVTVGEIMTPNVLTTTPDAPMEHVAAVMRERKIGALPVLRAGDLAGLITESDVFRAFADIFAATGVGARITFDISKGEDILPLVAELVSRHGLKVTSMISLPSGNRRYCVLRVSGAAIDPLLEDLWKSKHRIESVIRQEDDQGLPPSP
ncbi:MAG TPA: CBS domain-containing protein [Steroidobacteraceae bacterium]|nr:CBS domain-containing protein [Steroidobacteraceae bacterium]